MLLLTAAHVSAQTPEQVQAQANPPGTVGAACANTQPLVKVNTGAHAGTYQCVNGNLVNLATTVNGVANVAAGANIVVATVSGTATVSTIATPKFTAVSSGVSGNTDLVGVITASAGTATYSFSGVYTSAPVCVVQDDTTIASLLTKTVTTTALTVTTTGTTDHVSYICAGRN